MSKYSVYLTEDQRKYLERITSKGEEKAAKIMHAHVLLKTDKGPKGPRWTDKQIQEAFGVGSSLLSKVRKRLKEEGLEAAIERRRQPRRPKNLKIDGEQEAQIIAVLCTEQPEGAARWTVRALADRAIELKIVESVSYETVRKVLSKNELKPWQKKQWCIGPQRDGHYVQNMEDVLEVYVRPYDPQFPQVCLDEGGVQFVHELRSAIPMERGKPRKEDYEYEREGFASVFMACEPLGGKRVVEMRERRTKKDFALFVRDLIDTHYKEAERIVLVMDNLNTHRLGSLYDVFPPEEARRLCRKIEVHYTPKHGSWLNMAEIELSVLERQALRGRIKDMKEACERVHAWQEKRNRQKATIHWQFTTADARIRLARLYPCIEA